MYFSVFFILKVDLDQLEYGLYGSALYLRDLVYYENKGR
jgi:hypothetical protein